MAKEWARPFYNSAAWEQARTEALRRDRYMCQTPGCWHPAEEVHHIIPLTPDNISDPNISLNPGNLRSLCFACHKAEHRRLEERSGARGRGINLTSYHFGANGEIIPDGGDTPRGVR